MIIIISFYLHTGWKKTIYLFLLCFEKYYIYFNTTFLKNIFDFDINDFVWKENGYIYIIWNNNKSTEKYKLTTICLFSMPKQHFEARNVFGYSKYIQSLIICSALKKNIYIALKLNVMSKHLLLCYFIF